MRNIVKFVNVFFLIIIISGVTGCSSPAPEPVYPDVSEITPVPLYTESGQNWNTDAICWIGVADDAKWNNFRSTQRFTKDLVPLVRDELKNIGYEVKTFDNEYITREQRLSIKKIILCKGFEIKQTVVTQGICFDMKLVFDIVDNPELINHNECEVWCRSVKALDEQKSWDELYKECVNNLRLVPEFRNSLEINSSF